MAAGIATLGGRGVVEAGQLGFGSGGIFGRWSVLVRGLTTWPKALLGTGTGVCHDADTGSHPRNSDKSTNVVTNEGKGEVSIQVLNKVAIVLDLLAEKGEITAGEIAADVGEPRSSVYRLLGSLQQLEMVEPGNRRGSFRLGLGLLRLGSAVISRFDERQAALPAMESLHEATGETVFLCIRRGWEAVCVERLDGERVQSLALRLGGSLPLHTGAAPRVLLAFEPVEVWEAYLAENELEAMTRSTPSTKAELFRALEKTRDQGFALSDQDVTPGIAAIGAPLFDYEGKIRGAVSISGTRPMIMDDLDGNVERVMDAGRSASRELGYEGEELVHR